MQTNEAEVSTHCSTMSPPGSASPQIGAHPDLVGYPDPEPTLPGSVVTFTKGLYWVEIVAGAGDATDAIEVATELAQE